MQVCMICKITPTWYEKLHNSNYNVLTESSQMCLFNIHRCLAVAGGGGVSTAPPPWFRPFSSWIWLSPSWCRPLGLFFPLASCWRIGECMVGWTPLREGPGIRWRIWRLKACEDTRKARRGKHHSSVLIESSQVKLSQVKSVKLSQVMCINWV